VIEISREKTAKRAGLFLPVGGQRLISDKRFFEQRVRMNKSRSADAPRRVQREQIAKRYQINIHPGMEIEATTHHKNASGKKSILLQSNGVKQ
jgi:hypothetical protein